MPMRPVFAVAAIAGALLSQSSPAATSSSSARVERVLVVTLPNVSWADFDRMDLPNFDRLFRESAIGDLTTRASLDRRATRLGDGYITLGAGTRAIGDNGTMDGLGLGVDEPFGVDTAGVVFERRTGRTVTEGVVQMGIADIVDRNEALPFDAEPGALGEALADAGYARAVIANADGSEPSDVPPVYRRQAVSALMDEDGVVPGGAVGPELLVEDRGAVFGLRYDNEAVVAAFDEVWKRESVVLVEASELARTDAYRGSATPARRKQLTADALRQSDELVGDLLGRIDPERDAVVVVGPAHPQREITLTVAALRAPGVEPGLLRSATTRRSGFVQLVDVAPTILDLLDIDRPTSMEGRPFEVGREGGSASDRRDFLVDADEAARFRDGHGSQVTTVFVVGQLAVAVAAALWLMGRVRGRGVAGALRGTALALLGFLPAVYLARTLPFHDLGAALYWVFLVSVALALAAAYEVVGHNDPRDSVLAALAVTVGVLVVDVLLGAPLQLNSAFGYSPTVAGRFAGFGNLAYAALAGSTVLLAAFLANRIGRRRGAWAGVAVLAVVLVVDGMPFWGSDVGGVLSMAPAFAITGILLLGWQVRPRVVALVAVGTVLALGGFALIDLARPVDKRTHLGRLVVLFGDEGVAGVATIIERKLGSSLETLSTSVWGLIVPVALVFLAYLARRSPVSLRDLTARFPELQAAIVGVLVLAVLGFTLNDSGIAVPGVMLGTLTSVLVVVLTRVREGTGEKVVPRQPSGVRRG
ncbi:MAG: hypothetical protein H0V95_07890 [Actinobacteria bacterium]|nr:hypothetical protein [Actinomycetota bacterium]